MTNPIKVPEYPLFTAENGLCRLDLILDSEGNVAYDCDWCLVAVQGTSTNLVYRVFLKPIFPISGADLTYPGVTAPNAVSADYVGTGVTKTFTVTGGPSVSTFDNGVPYFDVLTSSPVVVTDTTYGTGLAFYVKFIGEPGEVTPIDATYYATISITATTLSTSQTPSDTTVWTIPQSRVAISAYPTGLKNAYSNGVGVAMVTGGWSQNKGVKGQLETLSILSTATGKFDVQLQNLYNTQFTGNLLTGGIKDYDYRYIKSVIAKVDLDPTLSTNEWSPTTYFCNYFVDVSEGKIVVYTYNSSGTLAAIGANDKLTVTVFFEFAAIERGVL